MRTVYKICFNDDIAPVMLVRIAKRSKLNLLISPDPYDMGGIYHNMVTKRAVSTGWKNKKKVLTHQTESGIIKLVCTC